MSMIAPKLSDSYSLAARRTAFFSDNEDRLLVSFEKREQPKTVVQASHVK